MVKCNDCGRHFDSNEINYFNGNAICDDCCDAEIEDEKVKNSYGYYGSDSDEFGICDYCGKNRKYGNCSCV